VHIVHCPVSALRLDVVRIPLGSHLYRVATKIENWFLNPFSLVFETMYHEGLGVLHLPWSTLHPESYSLSKRQCCREKSLPAFQFFLLEGEKEKVSFRILHQLGYGTLPRGDDDEMSASNSG
jgi:hypothetical protein